MLVAGVTLAHAQGPVPVTADNFVRAESDLYFGGILKDSGGALGKFNHRREMASVDHQTVIRLNRDTMYSSALFDLAAGPVTITLPDAGKRFRSMQVTSEDHYVPMVVYNVGVHTLMREKVGTRYAAVAVRTLVDPNDARDVQTGPRDAGRDQGRAEGAGNVRDPELGPGEPEEGARCAAGPRDHDPGLQGRIR